MDRETPKLAKEVLKTGMAAMAPVSESRKTICLSSPLDTRLQAKKQAENIKKTDTQETENEIMKQKEADIPICKILPRPLTE